jgi:hypothetical protein
MQRCKTGVAVTCHGAVVGGRLRATNLGRTILMADEPQAGTVSADQAMMLLLLDGPAELKRLQRNGAFRPMAPCRYRLVDLVQGYVRYVRKPDAREPVSGNNLSMSLSDAFACGCYLSSIRRRDVCVRLNTLRDLSGTLLLPDAVLPSWNKRRTKV